jgi:predicted nucleic acid-binding protein
VSNLKGGSQAVIELVSRGLVAVPFRLDAEAVPIEKLLAKYASVPMSLADACLVRMAEQYAASVVLTLDGDFKLYRKNGRQVIPIVMPEGL